MQHALEVKYPKLKIVKLLQCDLSTTYEGYWDSTRHVVVKVKGEEADKDNEIEVLQYLEEQKYLDRVTNVPKSPRLVCFERGWNALPGFDDVWEIVVYEFIEASKARVIDINQIKKDIETQIYELASLGIVHGDIRSSNIIQLPDGSYRLIDYDRAISNITKGSQGITGSVVSGKYTGDVAELKKLKFPPLTYMIEHGCIPTVEGDLENLKASMILFL